MSILGVIVRARTTDIGALRQRLDAMPEVDVALDPGDGRLILVMADTPKRSAAASLADIALWPLVLNTSLVYEYSGPDLDEHETGVAGYSDWRDGFKALAAASESNRTEKP